MGDLRPLSGRPPFVEDTDACRVAERLGFVVAYRRRAIEITDEKALEQAGYTTAKPRPDYPRIARALEAGVPVAGAKLGPAEYLLRPAVTTERGAA